MNLKTTFKKSLSILFAFLIIFTLFSGLNVKAFEPNKSYETLNVALYGYVPDSIRFKKAVQNEWNKKEPNIKLNFVDWDCYSEDPPKDLDVFVFDAIYLSRFIKQGYLSEISKEDIKNKNDIIPFAMKGCTEKGSAYAIPQIICTNLLYSRKGDMDIEKVNSVFDLYDKLGKNKSEDIIPDDNKGLLFDMSGGTSKVCMYLDSLIDTTQEYTKFSSLPNVNEIDADSTRSLSLLQSMAGKEQANYWPENNDAYIRAKWFMNGKGRAYIGYTEAMSNMKEFVNDINFKTISLSRNSDIPIFYGDVVGINSSITNLYKKEKAIELANIVADEKTMVNAVSPDENNKYPQYLLPARKSVYHDLESKYPVYGNLYKIANKSNNKLFRVGPDIREWLKEAKKVIPTYLE
ncbi:thiamine pyridinylase [Clostridium oceanicum]|uniref:Thiamine pyridinylase n=1 Tax=Clostridium oceanicum TaxID=1543 RepID=A0ABN1JF77_9CLOT